MFLERISSFKLQKISPKNPHREHVHTIDIQFFKNFYL
jgi:hypothetical protein